MYFKNKNDLIYLIFYLNKFSEYYFSIFKKPCMAKYQVLSLICYRFNYGYKIFTDLKKIYEI